MIAKHIDQDLCKIPFPQQPKSCVWGFGCLGKNEEGYFAKVSSGQPVVIKSKRDMIEVGKTYKVFHWDIKPRTRADNPHWSVTGS